MADSFRVGATRSIFRLMNQLRHVFWFGNNYNAVNLAGISSVPTGFPLLLFNDTVLNAGGLMSSMIMRYTSGFLGKSEFYVVNNAMNIVSSMELVVEKMTAEKTDSDNFI